MTRQAIKTECGMQNAECGFNSGIPHSAFRIPHFSRRPALTLIELLVTIVIMVTVLGAVIPVLSPNNDTRKIREAARELNSLISQAQSQAARNGRPVGVAFREFGTGSPYSGMALEAYIIAEPQPFSGFSENSRAQLHTIINALGRQEVDMVRFVLMPAVAGAYPPDPLPPNTISYFDNVEIGGATYRLIDEDRDGDGSSDLTASPPFRPGDHYARFGATPTVADYRSTPVATDWPLVNVDSSGWSSPRPYRINRQPAPGSDQPLQFPRGIGIDMQASGAVGIAVPPDFESPGTPDTVGIMFGPNGALQDLYFNSQRNQSASQIFLMVGRFENGNNGNQDPNDYDFENNASNGADDLKQRRGRINWLNPDSLWVSVNRAGRVITSENATFDPTPNNTAFITAVKNNPVYSTNQVRAQFLEQRSAAREYAEQMSSMGGRGR